MSLKCKINMFLVLYKSQITNFLGLEVALPTSQFVLLWSL